MHARKSIIYNVILFLAEIHCIDYIPSLFDFGTGRDLPAFFLYVFLIEVNSRHIYTDFALFLFLSKAVVNIVGVGAENVTASSAALYVFNCRLAEKRDLFVFFKRQCVIIVLEQNHTLTCGFSWECGVLGGARQLSAVWTHRYTRLISESCVFIHNQISILFGFKIIIKQTDD